MSKFFLSDPKENCIEWCNGEDEISVTLNQVRYISKVKKLAQKYPSEVKILAQNKDGSIFARMPLKALKLSIIKPSAKGFQGKRKDEVQS